MAAQVADRFDLGPDARLEVEAARGEQGQVRRLVTARGCSRSRSRSATLDADEAELTAAFQVRPATTPACPARVRWPTSTAATSPTWTDSRSGCRPGPTSTTRTRCWTPRPSARRSRGCTGWSCRPPNPRTVAHRAGRAGRVARAGQGRQAAQGRRSRDRLAALVPDLLAMEELLTPMTGTPVVPPRPVGRQPARHARTAPSASSTSTTPAPREPDRELAHGAVRVHADRSRPAARARDGVRGGGRLRPRHPRPRTSASPSPSCTTSGGTRSSAGCNARDPEARARAHAGVEEFVGDPFRVGDVERLLGWLRA